MKVGKLEKGRKTGNWYEYYTNGKKKIEILYTWNEEKGREESETLNEWNRDGKLKEEYIKKKEEEKKKKKKPMKF